MPQRAELIEAMVRYEAGCPQRVHHFLKVYAFAQTLGILERLNPDTQRLLETAAIVHDIGIRPSLEKYQSATGPQQEKEGPPKARALLQSLGFESRVVDRVCRLVGRHHTYTDIEGMDHQLLIEADFLVNILEGAMDREAVAAVRESVFRTPGGKHLLETMYLP